ncbi:MAG: 4Fe-4S dicluster domain-containing protein [Bacillota bacterium]|nr:4Fe-4S dicluster domain-containing protein [Bacillota bacterium]
MAVAESTLSGPKTREVLPEETRSRFFPAQVEDISGQSIWACMQCGTCTGSCQLAQEMDHTPRRIMEMVRTGLREQVLTSRAIWYCASCHSCTVRCPRGIQVTRVMITLKSLALRAGHVSPRDDAPAFYESFLRVLRLFGRMHEPTLVTAYALRTRPTRVLGMMPMALGLMRRGRMAPLPDRAPGLAELRRLMAAVERVRDSESAGAREVGIRVEQAPRARGEEVMAR